MKIQEVFDKYIENNSKSDTNRSSLGSHRGKIKKYITFIKNADIDSALTEKNLRDFIFDKKQQPHGKYDALFNFYKYYYEKILNVNGREIPNFPIDVKEVKVTSKRDSKREVVYFPVGFNFNNLFDDKHYHHLNNENAKLAIKASFSLALSAGYDTGEMFPTNRSNKSVIMTLDDCIVEDNYVKVRNYYTQSTVPWILIGGKNAEYIKDYYEVRRHFSVKHAGQEKNFIAHIWETSELNIDESVVSGRPYTPYQLVSYMLKYITRKLGLDSPVITDLRANMVFHSLHNSKGSALRDIIELYGYLPFVQNAFEEYCIEVNRGIDTYFSPLSFDIARDSLEDNTLRFDEDEKKKVRTREDILNKWIRDSIKVKKLKKVYNNCCQICGRQLTLIEGIVYSEVHHIQPFNKEHKGIDDYPNMLVLCPNHHKLFDLGIIALDPENHNIILHVDKNNRLNKTNLKLSKHELSSICVRYHFENIFLEISKQLHFL